MRLCIVLLHYFSLLVCHIPTAFFHDYVSFEIPGDSFQVAWERGLSYTGNLN